MVDLRVLLGFPLNIIEAIISNDVLEVRIEDVNNFHCKWAKAKYSQSQRHVRRAVVSQLASRLQFCYMSVETLKKLSLNGDFDPHVTTPLVMDALFFKSYSSCASTVNPHFVDKYRPPSRCLSSTCHSRDVLFTLTYHTRFVEACYP
ncbi:hypothetical protein Hdeb2414_s0003g00116381 [Helianthus debilis subsp. tardiflorus]